MDCGLPVLVYHKVDYRRELGFNSISPRRFERQIKFLNQEGYASISPQSLITPPIEIADLSPPRSHRFSSGTRNGTALQNTINATTASRSVLVTFDDGYEGIHSYAYPILKKYASTAIIFVTTGYIGRRNDWDASPGPRFRHLDWAHIKEMANDGIWFGAHGVNHTFLTRQSDRAARYEIEASKKKLEDGLGCPIHFFSYPYGDYDDRIISFVREAGYKAAFSLRPELLRAEHTEASSLVYALPRIAIYLIDNMWFFKAKIGCVRGSLLPFMQRMENRLINRCAYASVLAERLRS